MILEGRTVVVTGAGGGMGRGIAEAVAEAGAQVVSGDLAMDPVAETARRIETGGGRALPLVLDVTDPESVATAVARSVGASAASTAGSTTRASCAWTPRSTSRPRTGTRRCA